MLDDFIIGEGATSGAEYIVHTGAYPFICRVSIEGEDEYPVDGLTYNEEEDGEVLHSFVWLREAPDEGTLLPLLQRAMAALVAYSDRED